MVVFSGTGVAHTSRLERPLKAEGSIYSLVMSVGLN